MWVGISHSFRPPEEVGQELEEQVCMMQAEPGTRDDWT